MTPDATTYSYINMILLSVIGGAFFLLCTIMGYWASNVNKQLRDICEDQAEGSLRVHHLDAWTKNHDKQDDERHKDLKDAAASISRDLGRLFDGVGLRRRRRDLDEDSIQ